MFEQATRQKLRFDHTGVGPLTVEELWDLPLQKGPTRNGHGNPNLDDIARGLHSALKHDDNVSFVDKDRKSDETAQLKFDIVKHVIDVKLAEREAAKVKADNAVKKQKLLALIADKQDDSLKSLSIEELRRQLESL